MALIREFKYGQLGCCLKWVNCSLFGQSFRSFMFIGPVFLCYLLGWFMRSIIYCSLFCGRVVLMLTGVKVAWSQGCLLLSEGGLDFHHLLYWNCASIMKLLWLLITRDGSLWVDWVEAYILRWCCLWVATTYSKFYGCWMDNLRIQDRFQPFVVFL